MAKKKFERTKPHVNIENYRPCGSWQNNLNCGYHSLLGPRRSY